MAETINTTELYKCPRIEKCTFFQQNELKMVGLINRLKQRFCFRDNTRCARLWIVNELGIEFVPDMLMPNQYEWAQQILCDAGKSAALYQDAFLSSLDGLSK